MYRDDVLIGTNFSDLDGDLNPDKVSLYGIPFEENNSYFKQLRLIIESNGKRSSFTINMEGYDFKLFLGNIIKGKKTDQILITGQYGGTGGYATMRLFEYKNNKLKLILDDEKLSNQLNCSAQYMDNYKLNISCKKLNKNYTIDISKNFKEYLNLVYDDTGKASKSESPIISPPNTIYPIKTPFNDFYSLQIQQRIIGVSNGDILGAIQSVIEVDESGNISTKDNYFLLIYRQSMRTELPIGAQIISLDKFGGNNDILMVDLNNDGNIEILFAYKYNGNAYLGIGYYDKDEFKIKDTYMGNGYDISHLYVKPIENKNTNTLIVGFKVSGISSYLDLLIYDDEKLKSILTNKNFYFSKIDTLDFNNDGVYEIVLWKHDTGEAYTVNIYEYKDNTLYKIDKYNKLYFPKVLNYYEDLVKKYPTSSTYLYYLSKAQCILGIDFSETVNKMLKTPYPFPVIDKNTCKSSYDTE